MAGWNAFKNYGSIVLPPTTDPSLGCLFWKLSVSFNPEFFPGREHQQLLQHQHGPRELGIHEVRPLPDQGGEQPQLGLVLLVT